MAAEGEDDVADCREAVEEVCVDDCDDVLSWFCDADCDHDDYD